MVHCTANDQPLVLNVRFFCTATGKEPVRDWLYELPKPHRRLIGIEIKAVQLGWPLGMPLVRKMERGLWEIRVDLSDTCARIMFTLLDDVLVLLHGFIKKSQKTPSTELAVARERKARLQEKSQ